MISWIEFGFFYQAYYLVIFSKSVLSIADILLLFCSFFADLEWRNGLQAFLPSVVLRMGIRFLLCLGFPHTLFCRHGYFDTTYNMLYLSNQKGLKSWTNSTLSFSMIMGLKWWKLLLPDFRAGEFTVGRYLVTNYRHMVLTKGLWAVSALPKAFFCSLRLSLSCLVLSIRLLIHSIWALAVWVVEPVLVNAWSCASPLALEPSMSNRFTLSNLNCLVREWLQG